MPSIRMLRRNTSAAGLQQDGADAATEHDHHRRPVGQVSRCPPRASCRRVSRQNAMMTPMKTQQIHRTTPARSVPDDLVERQQRDPNVPAFATDNGIPKTTDDA